MDNPSRSRQLHIQWNPIWLCRPGLCRRCIVPSLANDPTQVLEANHCPVLTVNLHPQTRPIVSKLGPGFVTCLKLFDDGGERDSFSVLGLALHHPWFPWSLE